MDNNKDTNASSDRKLTPPTKPTSAKSSTSSILEDQKPIKHQSTQKDVPYEIPNPYASISNYFKKRTLPNLYSDPFRSFPVYVETLTGAVFEVMCNQFEPILGIKSKIYRLEGIPVSKQHLIYQDQRLEDDDATLGELNIVANCRLKLVIDIRGGPVSHAIKSKASELSMSGVSEFSLHAQDSEPESDESNTNIVFSHIDGKAVLIVIEKERQDSRFVEEDYLGQAYRRKSMLEKSMANLADDSRTNIKMRQIRQKMNERKIKKRLQQMKENDGRPILPAKTRFKSEFNNNRFKFPDLNKPDGNKSFTSTFSSPTKIKHDHEKFCNRYNIKSPRIPDIPSASLSYQPQSPTTQKYFDIHEPPKRSYLPQINENFKQKVQIPRVLPSIHNITKFSPSPPQSMTSLIKTYQEKVELKKSESTSSLKTTKLSKPPNGKTKRLKCQNCRKKIGLGMEFECRCNLMLCTKCRTAEVHNCAFDYKQIGRQTLKKENPLVAASKLPKIE